MMRFEDWWRQYPRKTAKHMARKEWDKMASDEQVRALAVIPLQAKAWRTTDQRFVPHGRTYLHQKRYLDDEFEVVQTPSEKWLEALYGDDDRSGSGAAIRWDEQSVRDRQAYPAVAGGNAAGS